ncbi:hypothetical protein BGZ46_003184 [Entomortierella lignicola]|nr:hypothetical protein BGZ46_003184 [Entomortierella lignicola]
MRPESAPVPNLIPRRNSIISSILDNRGGRGNNGGISINVGSGSLLHLHRPIVPREDSIKDQVVEHDSERQGQDEVTQSQDDGLNERNIPSTANTNNMGQTHHVYKTFPYNPSTSQGPQLEKRGDTKGYITKGTGSGGMFNKNDPYVRKK